MSSFFLALKLAPGMGQPASEEWSERFGTHWAEPLPAAAALESDVQDHPAAQEKAARFFYILNSCIC